MALICGNKGAEGGVGGGYGVRSLGPQLGDEAEGFEPHLPVFVGQWRNAQQVQHGSCVRLACPETVDVCHLHMPSFVLEL